MLSPLFPRYTHPQVGYSLDDLPDREAILKQAERINNKRKKFNIRLSFHPDQFNVLSSPHADVVENSIKELEYQGMLAECIGADVINIHAGGTYGDKVSALERFQDNVVKLSDRVRSRLTLENDDRSYSPEDLVGICQSMEIPFVYDVHHHRCLPDSLSIIEATELCLQSWENGGREPYFHISSPKQGYDSAKPRVHSDFISVNDVPLHWLNIGHQRDITIDVEAKAKEHAVLQLQSDINRTAVENPVKEQ